MVVVIIVVVVAVVVGLVLLLLVVVVGCYSVVYLFLVVYKCLLPLLIVIRG